ncbi:MAG: putative metal-binding motif-containing protein, partial [Nitrosopumilus sp.]|uniref:putative metal-binding motif-containing protein n=1 Tax=Nitrosopumilus sp. TaxID=2024843 RepID=UPI00242E95DC
MTQLMLSLLLLTVVGFSMVGIHDSFAADYSIEDDEDCGASGGFPGSWNGDDGVCELDNDFVLTSDDILEVTEVTLVIPNSISLENNGSMFVDEAGLSVDGTLNNSAEMEFATVEFNISGDLINSGTINISDSSFEVSTTGTVENLADGVIMNQDTPIGISGELNNYGELQNFGGYNVGLNGELTNFGTINTEDDREFTISGYMNNAESGNFIQSQGIFTNKGLVENYASDSFGGQFYLSSSNPFVTTKVNVEGTLRILQNSEFLNEAEIKLKNPGKIEIFGTLQNDGILQNGQITPTPELCGKIIGNTVSGTPPVDKCPIKSITISSPATNSKHGNVVPVTFTGTAIDVNAYGNEVPVTSSIIWTKTPLPQLTNQNGGSVSNQITTLGVNTIRATVTDSGGNTKFTTITINIFNDVDGDGYLAAPNGNDCDDNNSAINPGATEIFGDAIDNNCDGVVDNGFTDGDSDGYVEETLNVLPGFTDCDDNNSAINPGATEVFDGIDNNCDGVVDEGFTDFDMDGYATTTAGPQAIDCDDNNSAINPGATEVFDGIDNNCDGVVDEGFTDFDMDGYATTTAGPQAIDCDDNNSAINPGATEIFGDAIDNNCDGVVDNGFTDGDSDGYVEETLNVLPGFTDCDDNNSAINPGATEIFGDAIDNNCDGVVDNGFTDGDSDGYV